MRNEPLERFKRHRTGLTRETEKEEKLGWKRVREKTRQAEKACLDVSDELVPTTSISPCLFSEATKHVFLLRCCSPVL